MILPHAPGHGPLHRLPAAVKLAALVVAALALSLIRLTVPAVLSALAVVSALYSAAGLPWSSLRAAWWRLRWLIAVLAGALWLFVSAEDAVVSTGRVVALLLLADLVTRTTRMGDLMDVLRRILGPLRRIGADPEAVAMALSLTIAMIPVIAGLAEQVREAQRARGARLGPRAALPLLVMTMRHADDVGDALVARGLAR